MKKLNLGLICLFLAIPCQARTITVNWDGSGDFNTIQEGINAAVNGDTVVVADGIYTGDGNRDIDVNGLAITVRSTNPNDFGVIDATVIDCQGSPIPGQTHTGFLFDSDEDSNTVLEGLTITGGVALNFSGGIACFDSSPTIRNCIIRGNVGYPGGGISCFSSSPTVTNCIIKNNNSWGDGGGLGCFDGSDPQITNCTITGNSAFALGDGIYCFDSSPTITNCILWGDTPDEIYVYSGTPVVTYSDVQGGWPGLGNIDADPCFADPCNADYHLQSQAGRWDPNSQSWVIDGNTSPCIDAGNPGCPLGDEPNDPNNIRINMGAYGGTAEASKSPANWALLADLTNDRIVDFDDLAAFVNYWLDTGECIPSDLTRNQSVDFVDFAIMALHWLECTGPECGVQVTDVKIIRCELTEDGFQEIEEVDEVRVGDIFIIVVEVSNFGNETEHVLSGYGWDLFPENRVEVIGTPICCLFVYDLQPGESAFLYPFCLSQAFRAEGYGWVTMNIYVKDWVMNTLCEQTFEFQVIPEPSTTALLGMGLVGLLSRRKKRGSHH